jgi:NTE family protein
VRRLDELGILGGVRTISGVSGGSIIANLLSDPRLVWPTEGAGATTPRVQGFEERVAGPLRTLASHNIRTPALLSKLLPTRWFAKDAAVRALSDGFVRHVPWWSTPLRDNGADGPAIVIGATEIGYGVDWVFMDPNAVRPHGRIGDYRLGYAVPPAGVRLADSVAASCAFPPFFAPMRFDGGELELRGGHPGQEAPEARAAIMADVRLGDGGIYDNLGLEPVWKDHETVLLSDGGGVFRAGSQHTAFGRLLQILAIASGGGGATRMRWLMASIRRGALGGATWALDTVVPQSYPVEVCERVNIIRSDLDRFSDDEQKILERHGYLVADATVHAHASGLILVDAPLVPPHDEVADPAYALRALRDSHKRTLVGRF